MTVSGVDTLGTDGALFEALFRVRTPEGPLLAGLNALGIKPGQLELRYRSTQWVQALALYREQLFPELMAAEGDRKLGVELARSYTETVPGMILLATLPMLNPLQLLRRWPRFVRMGRTDVSLTVVETGPRAVDIVSIDPVSVPIEVSQGLVDFIFEKMHEVPRYVIERHSPEEVLMQLTW